MTEQPFDRAYMEHLARALPNACPAPGCLRRVGIGKFICKPHLNALPAEKRDALDAAHTPAQYTTNEVTPAYQAALDDAAAWLAENP